MDISISHALENFCTIKQPPSAFQQLISWWVQKLTNHQADMRRMTALFVYPVMTMHWASDAPMVYSRPFCRAWHLFLSIWQCGDFCQMCCHEVMMYTTESLECSLRYLPFEGWRFWGRKLFPFWRRKQQRKYLLIKESPAFTSDIVWCHQ